MQYGYIVAAVGALPSFQDQQAACSSQAAFPSRARRCSGTTGSAICRSRGGYRGHFPVTWPLLAKWSALFRPSKN